MDNMRTQQRQQEAAILESINNHIATKHDQLQLQHKQAHHSTDPFAPTPATPSPTIPPTQTPPAGHQIFLNQQGVCRPPGMAAIGEHTLATDAALTIQAQRDAGIPDSQIEGIPDTQIPEAGLSTDTRFFNAPPAKQNLTKMARMHIWIT
jgi:hypothetical protein